MRLQVSLRWVYLSLHTLFASPPSPRASTLSTILARLVRNYRKRPPKWRPWYYSTGAFDRLLQLTFLFSKTSTCRSCSYRICNKTEVFSLTGGPLYFTQAGPLWAFRAECFHRAAFSSARCSAGHSLWHPVTLAFSLVLPEEAFDPPWSRTIRPSSRERIQATSLEDTSINRTLSSSANMISALCRSDPCHAAFHAKLF